MEKIKIGIVGAGAVGGVISALLAEKGFDVEVAKRFNSDIVLDEFSAIEIGGEFGSRNVLIKAVNGVSGFTSAKHIIFILTQAYDAPFIAEQCLPFLVDDGIIVSSQNVMNIEDMINVVGIDKMFAVIINWSAVRYNKAKMDVIKTGDMIVGNFSEKSKKKLEVVQRILSNIAPTEISSNIIGDIWCSTIINSCISSTGALTGMNLRKNLLIPTTKKVFKNIIFEAMELAQSINIAVKNFKVFNFYKFTEKGIRAHYYRKKMFKLLRKERGKYVSNCTRAIENSQKSEIDYLNGYFVKLGKKQEIEVPTNRRMCEMVKEIEGGKRSMLLENMFDSYLTNPKKYLKEVIRKGV